MIKYADIKGYRNIGELGTFNHVYQFIEEDSNEPKVILVHAYEGPTEVFKGYLYNSDETFKNVELLEKEIEELEKYVGNMEQVGFDIFIGNTVFAQQYKGFTEIN